MSFFSKTKKKDAKDNRREHWSAVVKRAREGKEYWSQESSYLKDHYSEITQAIATGDPYKIPPIYRNYSVEQLQQRIDYCDKMASRNEKLISRLKKVYDGTWHGLEGKTSAIISLVGLIAGIFFFSFSFTGNAIGNLVTSKSIVGGSLIFIGLVAGFFWVKGRKSQ